MPPDSLGSTADLPIQEATLELANRNHNEPDNANNNIGFRVVCLPQHPSPSEPLEGSRPAPVIGGPRLLIRTAPEGAPAARGSAFGAGSVPFFSPQP